MKLVEELWFIILCTNGIKIDLSLSLSLSFSPLFL